MTNPLLKAAGITPDTKGHSAERALFDAAWRCVEQLRGALVIVDDDTPSICCGTSFFSPHTDDCPLAAFDKAAKIFQEDV